MKPEDDPRIRFVMARALAKQYLAKAEATIACVDRIRFRASRYLDMANEAMREAEAAGIDVAVRIGEERAIESEVWNGSRSN